MLPFQVGVKFAYGKFVAWPRKVERALSEKAEATQARKCLKFSSFEFSLSKDFNPFVIDSSLLSKDLNSVSKLFDN